MTITELNSLLQEAIKEVEAVGITTGEIDPDIELTRATRVFGKCRRDNINNIHTIYISKYFINNPTAEVKNTLVHEVLHTVEGCMNHGNKWKALANRMNNHYGYNIKRTANYVMNNEEANQIKRQYTIRCQGCGQTIYRQKKSKLITNTHLYRCGKCGGKLELIGE